MGRSFPLEKHQIDGSEFKDTGNQLSVYTGSSAIKAMGVEVFTQGPHFVRLKGEKSLSSDCKSGATT